MNKVQFHELLKDPTNVNALDAEALEKLIETFPYCNVANILLAKLSSDKGSMFSNQKIKRAALYSSSRGQLKTLLVANTNHKKEIESAVVVEDTLLSDSEKTEIENSLSFAENSSTVEKKTFSTISTNNSNNEVTPKVYFHEGADQASKDKMQNLRDEIQEVLQNLKGLESAFRDKMNLGINNSSEIKKNPLDIIRESEDLDKEPISENTKKEIEAVLVDQPLKFYVHQLGFGKSLKNANFDIIDEYLNFRPFEIEQKPDLETQASIIDKFLESNIQMPRFGDLTENNAKPDLSKLSTKLDDSFVSENMATIFEKQGKIKKAIEVYEKLKLKNPDKSAYFASKIENLNSLNN